jgi:signal transduction histidine kinase
MRQHLPAVEAARNRRLSRRFVAASAAVVLTITVLIVIGFAQFFTARANWLAALEESGEARSAADLNATFWHEHEAGLAYLSTPAPAGLRVITAQSHRFHGLAASLAPQEKPRERRLLRQAVAAEEAYDAAFARARAAARAGTRQQAGRATARLQAAAGRVHAPLAALNRADAVSSDAGQAAATATSGRVALLASLVSSLAVASTLAFTVLSVSLLGRALRRENELRAALTRLRELDRMKDEFISLVSHELRTPLTSIIGFLELLGDPAHGTLTEQQRSFTAVMQRNADRLLHLAGDVLLLSRLESGEMAMRLGDADLAAVARREVAAAGPGAERKGITLTLSAGEVPHVRGDEERLAQLLGNLLANALKFTPAGGRVSVSVTAEDGSVAMTVADTGIGLSAEDREHIFERFYRTPATDRQAIQGTGLGLTICQTIASAHGGTISVDSEPGRGAAFRVHLPAVRPADGRRGGGPAPG